MIGTVIILAFAVAAFWYVLQHKYDPHEEGKCAHCGYDLRASTDRCPECGLSVPPEDGEEGPGLFDDLFAGDAIAPRTLGMDERTVLAAAAANELQANFFVNLLEHHGIPTRVEAQIRQKDLTRECPRVMVVATDADAAKELVAIAIKRLSARHTPIVK